MIMQILCFFVLVFAQSSSQDPSVEALHHEQQQLVQRLYRMVDGMDDLIVLYEQQGLEELTYCLQAKEVRTALKQILSKQLPALNEQMASLRTREDLTRLESAQSALLERLQQLSLQIPSPDATQQKARAREIALRRIDDLITAQMEVWQTTKRMEAIDPLQETQQRLAAEASSIMLTLAERTPDVAKVLQQSLQSMRLAARSLQRGQRDSALQREQQALEQLRQAYQSLQGYLDDDATAEVAEIQELLRTLAALGELLETQAQLEEQVGSWGTESPPRERLDVLHRQRAMIPQVQQLQRHSATVGQALDQAAMTMQESVRHLTKAKLAESLESMHQGLVALQEAEFELVSQWDDDGQLSPLMALQKQLLDGPAALKQEERMQQWSALKDAGMGSEIGESVTNALQGDTSGAWKNRRSAWKQLRRVYRNQFASLLSRTNQTPQQPLLRESTGTIDEQDTWTPQLKPLETMLTQTMQQQFAPDFAEMLRKYYKRLAEEQR